MSISQKHPKKVLITGISGQDGSYMSEYCLDLGHEVYGMVRRTAHPNDHNFKHLKSNPNFKVVRGDLTDGNSLDTLVKEIQPDYFINFAAQSFVGDSWRIPEQTFMATAVGVLKALEAIRNHAHDCRFYNAGSSEQFGDVVYSPQNENHPFRPRSPYGAAKVAAHSLVKVYRESYNLYAIQGLLFNHESERRGEEFVTRKITKGFARIEKAIRNGQDFEPIHLGNIDAKRDWSHARDFMDAVWRMLNQEDYNPELKDIPKGRLLIVGAEWKPCYEHLVPKLKEYVVSSGETHTVREFIKIITNILGYDCEWRGKGDKEHLYLPDGYGGGQDLVVIDPEFYRPADVNLLLGDPTKAITELGWKPKIPFDKLAKLMLESDLHESGLSLT